MTLAEDLPPVGSSVPKMKVWIGQSLKFLPEFMLGDRRKVCGQPWEEASKCVLGMYGHWTIGSGLAFWKWGALGTAAPSCVLRI